MSFLDQRLELAEDWGTESVYQFKTTINICSDGAEHRNINWECGLTRFNLSKAIAFQSDVDLLQSFHAQVQGRLYGFRFKDWCDYAAVAVPDPLLLNPYGAVSFGCVGLNVEGEYQLCKAYGVADGGGTWFYCYRPITRPVADTVEIYVSGALVAATVDYSNGRITIPGNPDPTLVRASFEFDVPVRFEEEQIYYKLKSFDAENQDIVYEIPQLRLKEIREPILPLVNDLSVEHIDLAFPLDLMWGALGGIKYPSMVSEFPSGWEYRRSIDLPLAQWGLGSQVLDAFQAEFLLCLFRVCRGRGVSFEFNDPSGYKADAQPLMVRFDSDELALQFLVLESSTYELLFGNAPIGLSEISAESKVYSLSQIWEITRKDDVKFWFTDCDLPLPAPVEPVVYANPSIGLSPSAIEKRYENSTDNLEIEALLSDDGITKADLLAGKYDEAKVRIWLSNRGQILMPADPVILFQGIFGEIRVTRNKFNVEARSYLQYLQQSRMRKTTSLCPLEFGKTGPNQCNKDLTGLIDDGVVITEVLEASKFRVNLTREDNFFTYGKCEFLTGANAGKVIGIIKQAGSAGMLHVWLWELPPNPLMVGDSVRLTAGCRRTLEACRDYGNILNFGGQPHIPGTDVLMRGL